LFEEAGTNAAIVFTGVKGDVFSGKVRRPYPKTFDL
jgi:hypothetical protein